MAEVFGEFVSLFDQTGRAAQTGCPVATVTRVKNPDSSGRGELETATLGDLPLDAEDILFLQHTEGKVADGDRLLLLAADADAQSYYCIGRC